MKVDGKEKSKKGLVVNWGGGREFALTKLGFFNLTNFVKGRGIT